MYGLNRKKQSRSTTGKFKNVGPTRKKVFPHTRKYMVLIEANELSG